MNETMGMSYASLYYAEVGKNNELQKDNKQLKDLCDKYEEEHSTTFEEWKKDIKANKKAIEYIEQIIDFVAEDKREIERDKYILKLLKGDNK